MKSVACFIVLLCGAMQWLNGAYATVPTRREVAVGRKRNDWEEYVKPIVKDGTFRRRYRMSIGDFNDLYSMLRSRLERDEDGGIGRNGTVRGEWALAGTLRWLAGGSIEEVMMGPHVAKTTAYAMIHAGVGGCGWERRGDVAERAHF